MKKAFFGISVCLMALSCTVEKTDVDLRTADADVFYASFESDTRVYLDENVKILWNENDLVSIFNRKDANDEYRFTGETGDNAGSFKRVKDFSEEGVSIDHIYAVYPYDPSTSVSLEGVLSVTLPSEQSYAENTFGLGANTMVSATDDNNLLFRNACGFLVLKFYGAGVSVSSVKLEGKGGQGLSGPAKIEMEVGGVPSVSMCEGAGTSVTLKCDTPVQLGATKDEAVLFWLVVPPTEFTGGFTLTVTDSEGGVFVKETSKDMSIVRNRLLRISAIEVVPEPVEESSVIEMGEGFHLQWATCNVGAENPWEYGDYFAWGETEPYYVSQDPLTWKEGKSSGYAAASYSFGPWNAYTRYNSTDNKTELEPEDDAATVNLGEPWRMPTKDEWAALLDMDNFTWAWQSDYKGKGVSGHLVTSKVPGYEGNSIFLPGAGFYFNTSFYASAGCNYWSSTLASSTTMEAIYMSINSTGKPNTWGCLNNPRYAGLLIRPVSSVTEK